MITFLAKSVWTLKFKPKQTNHYRKKKLTYSHIFHSSLKHLMQIWQLFINHKHPVTFLVMIADKFDIL